MQVLTWFTVTVLELYFQKVVYKYLLDVFRVKKPSKLRIYNTKEK